jgi:hypothetical protein
LIEILEVFIAGTQNCTTIVLLNITIDHAIVGFLECPNPVNAQAAERP